MNLEKLYKENIHRKTQEVEEIISNFTLKSELKNLSKKYKIIISISIIILIIMLFIVFFSDLKAIISSFLLFGILILFSIYFNTYSIIINEKNMNIKLNGTEIIIPKKKIKNIYLQENIYRIFFKKVKSYSLVILYETPKNNIYDVVLKTTLLSIKDLEKWFLNITLKPSKVNYQEKCIKYKRKRLLKKFILFSIMMLLTFIVLLIFHIY